MVKEHWLGRNNKPDTSEEIFDGVRVRIAIRFACTNSVECYKLVIATELGCARAYQGVPNPFSTWSEFESQFGLPVPTPSNVTNSLRDVIATELGCARASQGVRNPFSTWSEFESQFGLPVPKLSKIGHVLGDLTHTSITNTEASRLFYGHFRHGSTGIQSQKETFTAPGVPRRSPIQVLSRPDCA